MYPRGGGNGNSSNNNSSSHRAGSGQSYHPPPPTSTQQHRNQHRHQQQSQQQQQQQQQSSQQAHPSTAGTPQQPTSARAMDRFGRFEHWLRENGAKFEMLELREYDCGGGSSAAAAKSADEEKKEPPTDDYDYPIRTGSGGGDCCEGGGEDSEMRGVHSRTHVPPNTVCMCVPRRCLITVEMGQATPLGQAILHSDLDLDAPKHIFLMIYVLWDRKVNGANSFFHPYYEILPPTLRNMPIFWSDDELAHLEGSYLLQQIQDRNQAITEDYHSICRICPSLLQVATLDEFKWARMCVCSRNFGLQMDGHRTSALVPHADMLNHYRPRETKWTFDEERQAFTITSLQPIRAGAQVYDSYGQKCNHRFLLNYGFAVEDNRELDGFCPNEVPLELYVDPDDDLFAEKLEYWTRGEGGGSGSSINGVSGGIGSSLLAASSAGINNSNSASATASAVGSLLHSTGVLPGGPYGSHNNNSSNNGNGSAINQHYHGMNIAGANNPNQTRRASPPPPPPTPVVKRVRVCVSNNENTRLLFSLLRALACNREELIAIGGTAMSLSSASLNVRNNIGGGSPRNAMGSSTGRNPYSTAAAPSGGVHDVGSRGGLLGSFPNLTTNIMIQQQHHRQQQQQQQQSLAFNNPMSGMPSFSIRQVNGNQQSGGLGPDGTAAQSADQQLQLAASASSSPASAYHRSCRDIRHPISLRNERAAMRLLLEIVGRHLQQYPTTLAQDLADLQDEKGFPRFSNQRHAKIQVRGEKEVLHHFAVWAQTALDVLDVIEEELREERGSVEVQLNNSQSGQRAMAGGTGTVITCEERPGFEYVIRRMEDDVDSGVHHTVLRYCADVLGSLRREEFKNIRRQHNHQQQQQQQHYQQRTATTTQQGEYPSYPSSRGNGNNGGYRSGSGRGGGYL